MNEPRRSFFRGVTDFLTGRGPSPDSGGQSPRVDSGKTPSRANTGLAFLRPPGAIAESDFLNTCGACLDCADACPYNAIQRLGVEFDIAQGTPAIIPTEDACYLCADLPCIEACSTGALEIIAREDVRMGLAKIDYDLCHEAQGQACDLCVTKCPIADVAISWDDRHWPRIHENGCTGCAVCAVECPADAIVIIAAAHSSSR